MFKALVLQHLIAAIQLTNVWTVETNHPETALQEYQEYRLGGMVKDDKAFYLPGSRKSLEKRSLQTGSLIWTAALQGDSQALWTLNDQMIYGGDTRGNLYAIDTRSGQIKWTTSTKGMFVSAPAVKGEQLWTMNSLGVLQSYDKSTGQWLWQQTDPSVGNLMLWSARGPILMDNQVIAGFPSALIQSFDAQSGRLLWKDSFQVLPGGSDSFNDLRSISGLERQVFASSFAGNLKVWMLDAANPKIKWEKKISLYAPVSFYEDLVILSAKDGSVQALDAENGLEKWKFQLSQGLGSQPVISNDGIWVSTTDGQVYLLSLDGKLKAKSNSTETPIWNAPLLVESDEVIVMTTRGILRRIKALVY
jgi:outer membrane protein assembly factor BamB